MLFYCSGPFCRIVLTLCVFFPPHRKIVIKIGKKKKRKPESSEESDDDPPPRHSSKDVDSVRLYTDTRRWTQTDVWCTSEYLTGVWNLHPELWDGACGEFAFIWLFFSFVVESHLCRKQTGGVSSVWLLARPLSPGGRLPALDFEPRQDRVCGSGGGHTAGSAISKCTFLSVWTMET